MPESTSRAETVARISKEIEEAIVGAHTGPRGPRLFIELPEGARRDVLERRIDWTGLDAAEKDDVIARVLGDVRNKVPEEIYPATWFDGVLIAVDRDARVLDLAEVKKQIDTPARRQSLDDRIGGPGPAGRDALLPEDEPHGFQVWHKEGNGYKYVADVESNALGAILMTTHGFMGLERWQSNPHVTAADGEHRSTTIGDVLVDRSGRNWEITARDGLSLTPVEPVNRRMPESPSGPGPDAEVVVFRKFPDGEVIALFPYQAATVGEPWHCGSYMHVGQHGAADPRIVADTRPASPDEYAALKAELEQLGYRLDVRQRFPSDAYDRRRADLQRHATPPVPSVAEILADPRAYLPEQGDGHGPEHDNGKGPKR